VNHNHVLHKCTIILTIEVEQVPKCESATRIETGDLTHGFYRIRAHFGFMELPAMPAIIKCAAKQSFDIDPAAASFFISGQNLIPTRKKGLPAWRKTAFILMARNSQKASEFFRLPKARTIELDWPIEI